MNPSSDAQSPGLDPATQVHLSVDDLAAPFMNGSGQTSPLDFGGEASTRPFSLDGQLAFAAMGGPNVLDALSPMNHMNGVNGMNGMNSMNSMNSMNGLNGLNGLNGAYSINGMPFIPPPPGPYMSPSMNPNIMTGNYGPAAAAAAAAAALNQHGRTIYVGNLPEGASVDELLNIVRFGPLENVKVLVDKPVVFLSFLDGSTAAAFRADAVVKRLALRGQELRVKWGYPNSVPTHVARAVAEHQATRNVFVGNLPPTITEAELRDDLSRFGAIDQVKVVRDKNIGFVHFLGISEAIKAVSVMSREPKWKNNRVGYGKDRCAYVPRAQQAAVRAAQQQATQAVIAQHAQQVQAAQAAAAAASASMGGYPGLYANTLSLMSPTALLSPALPAPGFASLLQPQAPSYVSPIMLGATAPSPPGTIDQVQIGNRTIFLGGLVTEVTEQDLCNSIRGGQLEQVKLVKDRGIAFVTFVEHSAAANFYVQASTSGFTVCGRRVKVGWGKSSGPLPAATLQAIQAGATRNVYIGGIQDFDVYNEAKLCADFAEYGDIELVNFFREKKAAYVNFTSINSAQKAVEKVKTKPEYASLRINFGKDRCAGRPRTTHDPAADLENGRGPFNGRGGHHRRSPTKKSAPEASAPTDGSAIPPQTAIEQEGTRGVSLNTANGKQAI